MTPLAAGEHVAIDQRGQYLNLARRMLRRVLLYLVVLVGAFIFVAPMLWLVGSSLKPERDVWEYPPRFIPREFRWDNYPYALSSFPFMRGFVNTMTICVGVMVGRLISATLVAYAFARLRFPLRDVLFLLVLSTMMIPYHVTLIPQFLIFRDLGWLNSFKPLVVPSFLGGGAFFIFLLRQFFMSIPKDYDDAARIDGCGTFGIFWRIILPMSLPALGTVAIFTFMDTWNDFLGPLIYLSSPEKQTLTVAYQNWQRQMGHLTIVHAWTHIMAIGVLMTIPPTLVFFLAQRYFIQGIVVSGIKG